MQYYQAGNEPDATTSVLKDNEVIILDDTSTNKLMICEE